MDADGQHKPEDISRLLKKLDEGYDMVVGARDSQSHASIKRLFGNNLLNKLASFMTGQDIKDLTSGFRAVKREYFKKILILTSQRILLPHHIHHGVFSIRTPRRIRIDRSR